MKMAYGLACLLASIAEDRAAEIGVPMAIALVDEQGSSVFFGRMDGALPASTELAVSKAYTSAALRMATHDLGKLARPGEALYGIQQTHQGRIVLFGGGLPLKLDGQIAGAIGISGGTVEQDIHIAQKAAGALREMEDWSRKISDRVSIGGSNEPPSPHRLKDRLQAELQAMDCVPSAESLCILAGAVLLALWK